MFYLWFLLIFHLYPILVSGDKATDDLLTYFSTGYFETQQAGPVLQRLSSKEWLFALVAALVLNIPLLLITSFFVDKRRFLVTFSALVNSRELFTTLLTSGWMKLGWPEQLRMLNAPQLKTILNLRRPLTQKQVVLLLTVFEQYQKNLEEQNNQAVLFWLRFKLTIQEQNFAILLLRCPLYSNYELTAMVRRARGKLNLLKKLQAAPKQKRPQSSVISTVSSLGERQQSKFEEIWTKLEETVSHQVDPNSTFKV